MEDRDSTAFRLRLSVLVLIIIILLLRICDSILRFIYIYILSKIAARDLVHRQVLLSKRRGALLSSVGIRKHMNAGVFQQTVKSAKMVDERKKLHDEQDRRNRRYEEDHADDVSGGAGRQGTRLFGLNSIHSVKFLDPWPILAAADGSGLVTFWSVRCPGRRDATQPFLGRISASERGKGVTSIFFTKIHNCFSQFIMRPTVSISSYKFIMSITF